MSAPENVPVAVLIPCYNYGDYVEACIASVAEQIYGNIELRIFDDGSRDNSLANIRTAVAKYRDRFLSVDIVASVKNVGKLEALNRMIPMVKAPVSIILDADDILHPDFISEMLPVLLRESASGKASFVYSDCRLVDASGTPFADGNSMPFDAEDLKEISYIPDCAPTMTRCLQDAVPFDRSIRIATKHHKWLKIVGDGHKGHYVPKPLFDYRMHTDNMSGIGTRVQKDIASGAGRERILSEYWSASESHERR